MFLPHMLANKQSAIGQRPKFLDASSSKCAWESASPKPQAIVARQGVGQLLSASELINPCCSCKSTLRSAAPWRLQTATKSCLLLEGTPTPTESNHDQLVVRVCWVSVGRLLSTFPPFLRTCKSSWNLLTPSPLLNISNQSTSHLTEQPAHQPTIQTKTGMSTQQPTGILLRLFAAPKTSGANSRPGYKSRHSTLPTKQVMHRPLLEDIFHL